MFVEYLADFLLAIGDIPAFLLALVILSLLTVFITLLLLRLTPSKKTPDAVIDFIMTCIPALVDMRLTRDEMQALAEAGQAIVDTFRPSAKQDISPEEKND